MMTSYFFPLVFVIMPSERAVNCFYSESPGVAVRPPEEGAFMLPARYSTILGDVFASIKAMMVRSTGRQAALVSWQLIIHHARDVLWKRQPDGRGKWAGPGPRPTLPDSSPFCIIEAAVSRRPVRPATPLLHATAPATFEASM